MMGFKHVLLLALCAVTLIAAKSVDRLNEATEDPQLNKDVVKRDDHDAAFHFSDKEVKNAVYSVHLDEENPKLSVVKKRSNDDDEKNKPGCCG